MQPDELSKRIGKSLQNNRKKYGYKSAHSFADHLSITYQTLICYEQGRRGLPLDLAIQIADEFDISLDELFGRDFNDRDR